MNQRGWDLPLRRVVESSNVDYTVYWTNLKLQYIKSMFGSVNHCAFSPGGKYFGCVSGGNSLVLRHPYGINTLDNQQGQPEPETVDEGLEAINKLISKTITKEGTAVTPEVGGVPVWSDQLNRKVYSIRFRYDSRLAVQTVEQRIVIKSTDTPYERKLTGHTRDIRDANFLTAQTIVSCSDDQTIKVWDIVSEQALSQSGLAHNDYIRSICPLYEDPTNTSLFLTGGYDHAIMLWDQRNSLTKPLASWNTGNQVQSLCHIKDRSMFCASAGNSLYFFDLRHSSQSEFNVMPIHKGIYHAKTITGIHYAPDSKTVITCSLDSRMRMVSLSPESEFTSLSTKTMAQPLTTVAVSPDSKLIAVGDVTGQLSMLSIEQVPQMKTKLPSQTMEIDENCTDPYAEKITKVKKALARYNYGNSLKIALHSNQTSIIVTLIEELMKRGTLTIAINGHNDKTIVKLLRWAYKHADHPELTIMCVTVIDTILQIYSPMASQSAILHEELLKAFKFIGEGLNGLETIQQSLSLLNLMI